MKAELGHVGSTQPCPCLNDLNPILMVEPKVPVYNMDLWDLSLTLQALRCEYINVETSQFI